MLVCQLDSGLHIDHSAFSGFDGILVDSQEFLWILRSSFAFSGLARFHKVEKGDTSVLRSFPALSSFRFRASIYRFVHFSLRSLSCRLGFQLSCRRFKSKDISLGSFSRSRSVRFIFFHAFTRRLALFISFHAFIYAFSPSSAFVRLRGQEHLTLGA